MLPEQFGPYRLEELIGRGGMGEVYRAFDTVKNRWVALKRLPPELASDTQFQMRFRREFELAARLAEPHVIPIHDFGEIDGRLYIDMRLVSGADLGEVLERDGSLPAERAVGVIGQIAAALDAAHADGLVHRDVKPSNVLVMPGDFVYLVDFGVAREVEGEQTALTATGSTVGTLSYLAPERFEGRGDHRVDVYALACVLFETLTGRKPFPVTSLPALLNAHLNSPPPRASQVRPELPRALDAVIACGMAKDPDARYPSAGALAGAAKAALVGVAADTATVAHPAPAFGPTPAVPFSPSAGVPPYGVGPPPAAGVPPYSPPAAGLPYPSGGAAGLPWGSSGPAPRVADGPQPPRSAPRRRWLVPVAALAVLVLAVALGAVLLRSGDGASPAVVPTPAAPPASSGAAFSVDLGGENEYVAISPTGYVGYVTSSTAPASLKVVGPGGELTASIPVGASPQRVTISPDGTRAYVANLADSTVTVVDTATDAVVATVPTGETTSPSEVAVSPDGTRAYVTTAFDVLILDTADNSPAGMIDFPSGSLTGSIAITPDGARAYVGSSDTSLSVVDLANNAITTTIDVGSVAEDIKITPDGTGAYVTNYGGSTVTVLDLATDTVRTRIELGGNPNNLVISPDGTRVYVAQSAQDAISVIGVAGDAVLRRLDVSAIPQDVAITPDGASLAVVYSNSSIVDVVDIPVT